MGQLPYSIYRTLDFLHVGGARFGRAENDLRDSVPRDDQSSLVKIVGKLDGWLFRWLLRRCVGPQLLYRDAKTVRQQTQYVQAIDGLDAPLNLREPTRSTSDLSCQLLLR
ncbi:hypothetical protein AMK23_11055 [Streptomyces sp. CB02130]|nr:hypothetical protein AMK23_11055 [Streptomyces sp. CB02130]